MKTIDIGWIGLGVMGLPMAEHLLDAGCSLTVYNRTSGKAQPLISKGAKLAANPKEVAKASRIVFTMVGYPSDVEEVILGENGVLSGLAQGGIICDMTTSSPVLAQKIASEAQKNNCFALDAPVTGGDVGARNASLSIFVGGEEKAWQTITHYLQYMGKKFMYCGGAGMGQQAKLANQVAIAGVMFSVCESLLYCQQAGLDVAKWLELVVQGAAGSTAMNTLGQRILAGDFEPGFFITHFVKDLGLCLEECKRMNLVLPGTNLANEFYSMMNARGSGKDGTQKLIAFLADLSGKDWKKEK